MRRDGDLLVEHVARAKDRVMLCAPFIKSGVLKRLFSAIGSSVAVDIVTRWRAEEVAAGVSDLAVFDLATERPGTTVKLLDNLHAKLYLSDDQLLAGSANLTATALGWCDDPNLELLTSISADDPAVRRCLDSLTLARNATAEKRDEIQAIVDTLQRAQLPAGQSVDETLALLWLPRLAAPERLFSAYTVSTRERLTASTIEAADHDLRALGIAPGLGEAAFKSQVADRFSAMPAIAAILHAARSDLTDAAGAELIRTLSPVTEMSAEQHWQIVRDWLTFFLQDQYEIAPQSFVTRLRPGAGRDKP